MKTIPVTVKKADGSREHYHIFPKNITQKTERRVLSLGVVKKRKINIASGEDVVCSA
jgi:hypothetical protein